MSYKSITQARHQPTKFWPLPLSKIGALIEIEYQKIESIIELVGGQFYNTPRAVVRAVSPSLDDSLKKQLLPNGADEIGATVIFSKDNARCLQEVEYTVCGLEPPDPETNSLGDLAFINYNRLIAIVPTDNIKLDMTNSTLPFLPMGGRVFYSFDVDDQSTEEVKLDSGIILHEKTLARDNQLATVTAVGPLVEHVKVGDRIIVRRDESGISYDGDTYFFSHKEEDILAVLSPVSSEESA